MDNTSQGENLLLFFFTCEEVYLIRFLLARFVGMPFLKPITTEQTKARQNLGDSKDHVLKGINAMKLRPDIMSGTFLVAEYFKDLVFHDQLYELQQELAALQEKLNAP